MTELQAAQRAYELNSTAMAEGNLDAHYEKHETKTGGWVVRHYIRRKLKSTIRC